MNPVAWRHTWKGMDHYQINELGPDHYGSEWTHEPLYASLNLNCKSVQKRLMTQWGYDVREFDELRSQRDELLATLVAAEKLAEDRLVQMAADRREALRWRDQRDEFHRTIASIVQVLGPAAPTCEGCAEALKIARNQTDKAGFYGDQ